MSNNHLLISVIITTYNCEQYVEECIASILKQTHQEFEIIIIDDCSTDQTWEKARSQTSNGQKVSCHQNRENMGVSVSRNAGLRIARGEYVIFLDGDDIFEKNLLQSLLGAIVANDADIAMCREYGFNQERKWELDFLLDDALLPSAVFTPELYHRYILNFSSLWAWDKLFRREFLLKNNIFFPEDKRMIASEDLVFTGHALCMAKRICLVEEFLINHRYHAKSLEANRNVHTGFLALRELKKRLVRENIFILFEESFANLAIFYLSWHKAVNKHKICRFLYYYHWLEYFDLHIPKYEYYKPYLNSELAHRNKLKLKKFLFNKIDSYNRKNLYK